MNRYTAEFFGTFVLVFASCGSAVLAGDKIGFLGVSLAFGLSLLAMVYAIGPISGCHINPAVTVGLLITGKMDAKYAPGYIVAQILGAVVAAGLLLVIVKGAPAGYDPAVAGFAANGYGEHSPGHYNLLSAFLVEVVLTFFLVFTVLGATDLRAHHCASRGQGSRAKTSEMATGRDRSCQAIWTKLASDGATPQDAP